MTRLVVFKSRRGRDLSLALLLASPCVSSAQERAAPAPTAATAQAAVVFAHPSDVEVPGVLNFARVSEALWRGAQPTVEGFRNLEKLGARTVVSFRQDHDDLPLLEGTGLRYLRIPSYAFHPTEAHLARFLKVMEDPANWPVYIHCAQGRDRTGYNAAAYRMVLQGWSAKDALREMNEFHFNKVWVGNPGFLKRLKVQALKARVAAEPAPRFQGGRN